MQHPTISYTDDIARRSIKKIDQLIWRYQDRITTPGLLTGHLGTALFHCLHAIHSGRQACLHQAKTSFEKALRIMADQRYDTYPSGLREVSMVGDYLKSAGAFGHGPASPVSALDSLILQHLRVAIRSGYIGGFSCGVMGYGIHFLNRVRISPSDFQHVITEIIQALKATAVYG